MAMVVKNNMSAVSTLNTLNKNSSALAKSLQKVSSGMKINSAADDASGYAISERMRVQIVFCQADFPIFVVGIPHRHRGKIPTFSGPCQEAGSTTASCRMRACSIR